MTTPIIGNTNRGTIREDICRRRKGEGNLVFLKKLKNGENLPVDSSEWSWCQHLADPCSCFGESTCDHVVRG